MTEDQKQVYKVVLKDEDVHKFDVLIRLWQSEEPWNRMEDEADECIDVLKEIREQAEAQGFISDPEWSVEDELEEEDEMEEDEE